MLAKRLPGAPLTKLAVHGSIAGCAIIDGVQLKQNTQPEPLPPGRNFASAILSQRWDKEESAEFAESFARWTAAELNAAHRSSLRSAGPRLNAATTAMYSSRLHQQPRPALWGWGAQSASGYRSYLPGRLALNNVRMGSGCSGMPPHTTHSARHFAPRPPAHCRVVTVAVLQSSRASRPKTTRACARQKCAE